MSDRANLLPRRPAQPSTDPVRRRRVRDAEQRLSALQELPVIDGAGDPLPHEWQQRLGPRIHLDLSGIRLHRDQFAADLTKALNAEAVTNRGDIFLAPGHGDLATPAGRSLLVHELFHSGASQSTDPPVPEEEVAAERAGANALRSDFLSVPLTNTDGLTTESPTEPTGLRRSNLARRATTTLERSEWLADPANPDVVSAGEALVILVDHLIGRDPADHGGRLASVLGRLDESLRDAVVTAVVDRRGGSVQADLQALAGAEPEPDGGTTDAPAAEAPVTPADDEAVATEGPVPEPVGEQDLDTEERTTGESKPAAEDATVVDESEVPLDEKPPAAATLETPAPEASAEGGEVAPPPPAPEAGGGVAAAPEVPAPAAAAEPDVKQDTEAEPEQTAEQSDAGTETTTATEEPTQPELVGEQAEPTEAEAEEAAAPSAVPASETAEPDDPPEISEPPDPERDEAPALPDPAPPAAPAAETSADTAPAEEATESEPTAESDAAADAGEPETPSAEGTSSDTTAPMLGGAMPGNSAEGILADPQVPTGGGGGGAAIADPPESTAPDVSALEPQAALGAVASLPATKLAAGLSGVNAAAQRTAETAEAELAANPPSMQRPSGVPADKDASLPPAPLPPLPAAIDRSVPGISGGPGSGPPQPATPPPAPAPVTARVPEATMAGDTQVSAEDAARIQGAVSSLPTTDPALNVDAGPVPELELTGGEDPALVGDQAGKVAETTMSAQQDGLTDARADMGENDVLPQVPNETLTADLGDGQASSGGAGAAAPQTAPTTTGVGGSGGNAGAGGKAGSGEIPAAAIDAVAGEQGGAQIDGATQSQGTALGAARDDHDKAAQDAKDETDKQINDEISGNGSDQTAARAEVRTGVGADRKAWVGEQDDLATTSRTAADSARREADSSIGSARTTARGGAGKAIQDGNAEIVKERRKAETAAREKRAKAEEESSGGGFFSWLGSKVKRFFNAIKEAIHAVFEFARKVVDAAISAAQKLAVAAIELGRKAVVAAIELGGKALAAAGDIVLVAFPKAREKFRKKIREKVDAAKKKVNDLADKLKAGVTKLLDGLGKFLKGALSLLEKAYTMAIDAVAKVVDTAIKAAKAWVDALVDFAILVSDIASNPGQWLRNLGAGLLDGVKNHVWPSLVKSVKEWFKSKVEEVVGVGKAILELLRTGGITFAKIVTMAWTAIKESLPGIIIQLLIEKLVALLIPAGGAIALIIDGLKAAWGAAAKILAAFQKFIAFLKAVKSGNAGPSFGELVGAAAVAVMDFLANFVLSKLKGAGQKVGGTLRKMAEKFVKAIKKVAGAVKRGAKAAAGAIKRGVAAAGKAINAVLPKNLGKLGAKAVKAVGDRVKKGVAKAKAAYTKAKEKLFGKDKKPKKTKEEKIARAIDRTRKTVGKLLAKGVSRLRLWATLKWLKVRWGWKQLERKPQGADAFTVDGVINPPANIGSGVSTLTILHAGAPVSAGTVTPSGATETPEFGAVRLGPSSGGLVSQQYPSAIIGDLGGDRPLIEQIAEQDIGRPVRVTLPPGGLSSRPSGGASTLELARLNAEMAIRKGDPVGPFVRPDVRTALVPGVDPLTGRRDRSQDSVHLYEITTITNFIDGNRKMAIHKQSQATWTITQVLSAFPGARVHYTFIAPAEPESSTKALIQQIVTGLSVADQSRFTVSWRAIGYTR